MEKSFGLSFFLKKNKHDRETKSVVYMHITVDGETCDISTKRKCELKKWNKISGRMHVKEEGTLQFNAYLDTLQQKVFEAKRKLLELDKEISPAHIKDVMLGKSINRENRMVMEIFQHHNDQMKSLVGKEYAPGTLQRYETSYRHTKSFIETRYKTSDLDINRLNFEFLSEYEFWLKSVRKCDHNSAMKYLLSRCPISPWQRKNKNVLIP